jgi:Skp family chaperone for outer membrane proteins
VKYSWLSLAGATLALTLVLQPSAVLAQGQQNPGWFVPNQPRPAARPSARPAVTPTPAEAVPPTDEGPAPTPQIQVQLPPAPELPQIAKGPPTPAAIVGVVSIPDALRVSTAYQEADKTFNDRHKKLDEDAQKEQVALRDLGQQLANERAKLTPEQIRGKERELQDRIADSRKKFGDRQRVIQEAGQYVMMQINRTLEQVVQQVAVSRGINIVLNRAQVLGTTADFDLTPQVVEVLNKVLPAVVIPPDGVSPLNMTIPKEEPRVAAAGEAPKAEGTSTKPTPAKPTSTKH